MDALDRRFFREQYDAHRLLREVAEQVRAAASFEQAAPKVGPRSNRRCTPSLPPS
jgi:hypothetical protein